MGGNVRGVAAAAATPVGAMSTRRDIRSRQLNTDTPLQIVRRLEDLDEEEGGATRDAAQGGNSAGGSAANNGGKAAEGGVGDKKKAEFIPIPESLDVPTYGRDYPAVHVSSHAYIRTRRAELDAYVEYDLDDEDEAWLTEFNGGLNLLHEEKLEAMLNALEHAAGVAQEASLAGMPTSAVLDHSKIYVSREAAFESMRRLQARHASCTAVYEYWLGKRKRVGMPLLRQFQPPPPQNDQDPFKVFRPREKTSRPHTRRKRENDFQGYRRLHTVRSNLAEAAELLGLVHRRERLKREVLDVTLDAANARLLRAHSAEQARLADKQVARQQAERLRQAALRAEQAGDTERYMLAATRAQLGLPFTDEGRELVERGGREALLAAHGRTAEAGAAAERAVAAATAAGVTDADGGRRAKKRKSDKQRRPLRGMPTAAQIIQLRNAMAPRMEFTAPMAARAALEANGAAKAMAEGARRSELAEGLGVVMVPRMGRNGRLCLDRCDIDGAPFTPDSANANAVLVLSNYGAPAGEAAKAEAEAEADREEEEGGDADADADAETDADGDAETDGGEDSDEEMEDA